MSSGGNVPREIYVQHLAQSQRSTPYSENLSLVRLVPNTIQGSGGKLKNVPRLFSGRRPICRRSNLISSRTSGQREHLTRCDGVCEVCLHLHRSYVSPPRRLRLFQKTVETPLTTVLLLGL